MTEKIKRNELFKNYRTMHREYFKQRGWNVKVWLIVWRYVLKNINKGDEEILFRNIITLIGYTRSTKRIEKIKQEMGLEI